MPKLRDNLTSAAIGGSTGVVAALGVIAVHGKFGEISAGDLLQFFGALAGTLLAIGGAVWIEERKRMQESADLARPVLDVLLTLERKTRPFFGEIDNRMAHAEEFDRQMIVLDQVIALAPPRTARLISLFQRLRFGAAYLTSNTFLDKSASAEIPAERHKAEDQLEIFDDPLKMLIVEYARMVDPNGPRSVPHLGAMPEP
jgi:hypothetical protein